MAQNNNNQESSERQIEREIEDRQFHSVIIKRNDEIRKHPDDTLEVAVKEGEIQHKRTPLSLLLSSFAAGLVMGVTVLSVAFAHALSHDFANPFYQRLIVALFYPLGFIICIMGGTQLFTEQTSTAFYPILDRKVKFNSFGKLLSIVLIGNFLGTFVSAYMLSSLNLEPEMVNAFIVAGEKFISHPTSHLIWSSILAGWLMALGAWLVLSMPHSTGQLLCIFIVTFVIGIGGFHHSIAGSGEVFAAYLIDENPEVWPSIYALFWSVVGNVVGGSVFVALLNYGHIRGTVE